MNILASVIKKHPRLIIFLVILVTLFLGYSIRYLKIEADISKAIPSDFPEVKYFDRINEIFPKQEFFILGMISDNLFSVEMIAKLDRLTKEIGRCDGVGKVLSPTAVDVIISSDDGLEVAPILESLPETDKEVENFKKTITGNRLYRNTFFSEDMKAGIILIQVEYGDKREYILKRIKEIIDLNRGDKEVYRIAGESATLTEVKDIITGDILLLSPIVIIVIMIILFFSFRLLRGVLLPLLTVLISVIWALGIMALLNVPLSIMTTVLPTILIAVGSAYGIHIINRFTLEHDGVEKADIVSRTINNTGSAVLMAGLTTMAGFLSFLSSQIKVIREFGLFTAVGVVCALTFSLTFIPAMLYIMPPPRKRMKFIDKYGRGFFTRSLSFIGRKTFSRSWFFLLGGLIIFVFSLIGTSRLRVESDLVQMFGKNTKIMQDNEFFNKYFSGTMTLQMIVSGDREDTMKEPEVLNAMAHLQRFVTDFDIVGSSRSLADVVLEMHSVMNGGDSESYVIPESKKLISQYFLLYSLTGRDDSLENLVNYDFSMANLIIFLKSGNLTELNHFEKIVKAYIHENIDIDGVEIKLTGRISTVSILSELIVESQLLSIIISMILVVIITTVIFRAFIMGLIAIIPIILTIILNFGVMGWVGIPLDLATVLIASVSIGIGIDYSIHYINHYKCDRLNGKSVLESIISTNTITGKAILYNALAVGAGFLVLTLSSLASIGVLGIMIALTMFVSSTGAMTIIPAIFSLVEGHGVFRKLIYKSSVNRLLENLRGSAE